MNVIYYIIFILFFLIIYSTCFKTVEGFDDEFYYYNKLIDYKTIPNSYVNDSTPSRTINKFGFYKGKGTFKKGYTKETKSDDKISTLNKLLNRLLGRIVSDNQDCVGSFGKYSECDKSCGSNAFQTRKYNITKERGKNGKDCPFVDGYEEKKRCDLDECQLGDICKDNEDCESGNCNPNSTRCENMVPCDSENLHVCNENQCIQLNNEYDENLMNEGVYIYNNVDKECFFKTPAEIEELNLNIYTYDYRTISDQVKDIVLECDYYQVKKDGVGPCINRPNIISINKYPECSPGFGPEPTIYNGSHACSECIIVDESGQRDRGNENCFCDEGKVLNDTNNMCEPRTGFRATDNVCDVPSDPDNKLKFKRGIVCEYCPPGTYIDRENNIVNCKNCPEGTITFSNMCNASCSDDDEYNANTDFCNYICGISKSSSNNQMEYYIYNKIHDYGYLSDDDGDDIYSEKCFSPQEGITVLTQTPPPPSDCNVGQFPIGGICKCNDPGEYINESNNCDSCTQQDGCATDQSGTACLTGDQMDPTKLTCLQPKPGYYLDDNGNATPCVPQVGCETPGDDCVNGQEILTCSICNGDYYSDTNGICKSDMMISKPECRDWQVEWCDFGMRDLPYTCRYGENFCRWSYSNNGNRYSNCAYAMAPDNPDRLSCETQRASQYYESNSFQNECCQRPDGYPRSRIPDPPLPCCSDHRWCRHSPEMQPIWSQYGGREAVYCDRFVGCDENGCWDDDCDRTC